MKDSRPLSERFDLPYVRKKHFADRWTGRLGFVAAAVTAVTVGAFQMSGDDRPYTAGELTKAHDMFASDCMKCHEASREKGLRGYLMPATDDKCIACHENQAGLHASNQADLFTMAMPGHPDIRMSGNCAACHMEHKGRNHDLTVMSDQTCVQCHADLKNEGVQKVAVRLDRAIFNSETAAHPLANPTATAPAASGDSAKTEGGAK